MISQPGEDFFTDNVKFRLSSQPRSIQHRTKSLSSSLCSVHVSQHASPAGKDQLLCTCLSRGARGCVCVCVCVCVCARARPRALSFLFLFNAFVGQKPNAIVITVYFKWQEPFSKMRNPRLGINYLCLSLALCQIAASDHVFCFLFSFFKKNFFLCLFSF